MEGLGSTAVSGPSPCFTQPLSRAKPIRPAPTRSVACGVAGGFVSGLAGTLEHGGRDRFLRRLAAPQHELECRVIVLAGFHGEIEQRFALRGTCPRIGEYHCVAKNERSVFREQVEMTDPQLGVDVHQESRHLGTARLLYPHVEGGGQMQGLQIFAPREAEMMIAPATGHRKVQFVAPAALERPAVVFDGLFEHVEGVKLDYMLFLQRDGHPKLLGGPKRSTLRTT